MNFPLTKTSSLLYLPANATGDDYIVGDLHGHYDALQMLLKEAGFSEEKDRLICVGDLINRGPKSAECLELLRQPWFYAVAGNHDLSLRTALQGTFADELGEVSADDARAANDLLEHYGGKWACDRLLQPSAWRAWALESGQFLKAQPSAIVVEAGPDSERFHVVHAFFHNLISSTYFTDQALDALDGIVPGDLAHAFAWTKEHEREPELAREHEGLSLTYCGNCVVPSPQLVLGHLMIDTGAGKSDAIYGSKLTMICHRTQRQFQAITPDFSTHQAGNLLIPVPVGQS